MRVWCCAQLLFGIRVCHATAIHLLYYYYIHLHNWIQQKDAAAARKPQTSAGGGGGKGVRGYDAAIDPVLGCACRVCAAAAVGISIE